MSDASASSEPIEQRVAAMEQRIKDLEAELARAKADAAEVLPQRDAPHFIDDGTEHTELTDDAIAPPG